MGREGSTRGCSSITAITPSGEGEELESITVPSIRPPYTATAREARYPQKGPNINLPIEQPALASRSNTLSSCGLGCSRADVILYLGWGRETSDGAASLETIAQPITLKGDTFYWSLAAVAAEYHRGGENRPRCRFLALRSPRPRWLLGLNTIVINWPKPIIAHTDSHPPLL